MSCRTRNMAADAAYLAGLGAGPSGSASGHRAHRRLRAEQGRGARGALERSRLWPWRGAGRSHAQPASRQAAFAEELARGPTIAHAATKQPLMGWTDCFSVDYPFA